MFSLTKQSESAFRSFFGPAREPNYSRPTFLPDNRSEHEFPEEYNSANELADKLDLYDLRSVVETEAIGYDKSERMPKRKMPNVVKSYWMFAQGPMPLGSETSHPVVWFDVMMPQNGFRDSGLRFKRNIVRQSIVRKMPTMPETETYKQYRYWGDSTLYAVRDDGIEVGIHPLKAYAAELSEFLSIREINAKTDAVAMVGELPTYLVPYLVRLIGAFKRLVLEFGASGTAFEGNRFGWRDFSDFAIACVSTFYVSEGDNLDASNRPVLDSWRYAVQLCKRQQQHELRQSFDETAESVRTVDDDYLQQSTATSLTTRKAKLSELSPVERAIVEGVCTFGQKRLAHKLGCSESNVSQKMSRIRRKLSKVG